MSRAKAPASAGRTMLDLILDRVEARKSEVTLDVSALTREQIERVVAAAEARGFDASGTRKWLLIRDLRGMHTPRHTPNAPPDTWQADEELNVANPHDAADAKSLYRFWFGQIGTTIVYAWGDHLESAFEAAVEWLDDNDYAGFFTDVAEAELKEAAEAEGIPWNPEWSDPRWSDWDDPQFLKVVEAAEADLTQIGHTTLKHGQYLVSYEWGVDDVTDPAEWERVAQASADAVGED